MKPKYLLFPFILISIIFLATCEFNSEEELYGNCDTVDVNYADVQPIFEANCRSCHNATVNNKLIILSTYNDAVAAAQTGKLRKAINHLEGATPMPYGLPKLPSCPRLIVTKWIDSGTPQ